MAYVTRCPYCSSVWLLPNKEIAECGPVKCSHCGHSFDALSSILEVSNRLFPGFVETPYVPPHPTEKSIAAPSAKATDHTPASTLPKPVLDIEGRTEPSVGNLRNVTIADNPPAPTAAAQDTSAPPEVTAAPEQVSQPETVQDSSLARIVPADTITTNKRADNSHKTRKKSSIGSIVLIFILLIAIGSVCAVVFNQQLIEKFPQTKKYYTQVCQKIPCPGFFLNNIEAFVVSKANLIAAGETGNYNLEVTVVNGSSYAQAVPHLELQLVDESDALLQKCLLTPEQFQVNAQTTRSVAPGRALNIRVAIQTNVTPSRCVVIPVYP